MERNDAPCGIACDMRWLTSLSLESGVWTIGLVDWPVYNGWWFHYLTNHTIVYDGPIPVDSALHNDKYNEVNGEDNCDGSDDNCSRNGGAEGFIDDL